MKEMENYKELGSKFMQKIPYVYKFEPSRKTKNKWLAVEHGVLSENRPGLFGVYSTRYNWFFAAIVLDIIGLLFLAKSAPNPLWQYAGPPSILLFEIFIITMLIVLNHKLIPLQNLLYITEEPNKRAGLNTSIKYLTWTKNALWLLLYLPALFKAGIYFIFTIDPLTSSIFLLLCLVTAYLHGRFTTYAISAWMLRRSLTKDISRHKDNSTSIYFVHNHRQFNFNSPVPLTTGSVGNHILTNVDGNGTYQFSIYGVISDGEISNFIDIQEKANPSNKYSSRHVVSRELTRIQMEILDSEP